MINPGTFARQNGKIGRPCHIAEFKDKQQFLNTVYERFLQGYTVKTADKHGTVYTPQPIVDFICASVEEVPKSEFGMTRGSKGVNIRGACAGTGNFLVNLLCRIDKRDLSRVYREQLTRASFEYFTCSSHLSS